MKHNEPVFDKTHSNIEINCVSCGGSMYEIYTKQDGGYTHVQCDFCGHVMKLGNNKNSGRLSKPNPLSNNDKEV